MTTRAKRTTGDPRKTSSARPTAANTEQLHHDADQELRAGLDALAASASFVASLGATERELLEFLGHLDVALRYAKRSGRDAAARGDHQATLRFAALHRAFEYVSNHAKIGAERVRLGEAAVADAREFFDALGKFVRPITSLMVVVESNRKYNLALVA